MVESQNIITEMKNAFDGLINDWTWLRKPSMKIEDISVETSKTKRKKRKKSRISKNCGTITKGAIDPY